MTTEKFKYDVAFSFLARDEGLATELHDLVQGRMRTFIYSERQKELAGKDGEEIFNNVFGRESRFVVLLYRNGWGETPWTRVEKTAIQNRTSEEGHDFLLCVPLETPPVAPKWLPKNRIWIGLDRWGTSGAAAVIEARVQELGGEAAEETVAERAARLSRHRQFESEREAFLASEQGSTAAIKATTDLKENIVALVEEIASSSKLAIKTTIVRGEFLLHGLGPAMVLYWNEIYTNSIKRAAWYAEFCDRIPKHMARVPFHDHVAIKKLKFGYTLQPPDRQCWIVSDEANPRNFATSQLAQFLVKQYMDLAEGWTPPSDY